MVKTLMGHTKVKLEHEEELEDSFLDSLLNFDGWVEDHRNSSLAEIMNPQDKPNLDQIKKLKVEEEEEVCGLIEQGIGKVSLASADQNDTVHAVDQETNDVNENGLKKEGENADDSEEDELENDSDNGDDSETSSSSSSSGSDDESYEDGLEKVKGEAEMEEGEIAEEMPVWSDDDDDDTVKGPIRSANELQNLPPVPPVTVTIQPHHQTLPVGVVLSIMGSQVIVEGVEDHNPLSEGSILWITESRSPLGVVDEIFGPVKNPYYVVRYNTETEIPTGIQQGNSISFVPEFADYVLNNNNLYKKGYDASGADDEECSEELEFSDDEKEAEYKRMKKVSKRGSSGEKNGHMKKDNKSRNRGRNRANDHQPCASSQLSASSTGPQQAPNTTPSGAWPYGYQSIQPQNIGFPSNVPPFMQQNFIQQPFQNIGVLPFRPHFNAPPGQMFPHNFVQGVPPNFGAFASWPSGMPQNYMNHSQAGPSMVFQGLPPMANGGLQMENNNGAGSGETCQSHNQGGGGRRPFQRGSGGGRFRGGRSGQ